MRRRRSVVVLGVCAALLVAPCALGAQGGKKGGPKKGPKCETVTANAAFRDAVGDGISSDDFPYLGLENANVYLLLDADHDFVLDTRATGRGVTLNFPLGLITGQEVPFSPEVVEVLIRSDEVESETGGPTETRLIVWFEADDGKSYKMKFDGMKESDSGFFRDPVLVTNIPNIMCPDNSSLSCRQWTIESTDNRDPFNGDHLAQLERTSGPKRQRGFVDFFDMPVRITVTERLDKPPTCAS